MSDVTYVATEDAENTENSETILLNATAAKQPDRILKNVLCVLGVLYVLGG
jgi:hypothetical protein